MAESARETHIAAQRRHPRAYWLACAALVAMLPLALLDQRFWLLIMLATIRVCALLCKLAGKRS